MNKFNMYPRLRGLSRTSVLLICLLFVSAGIISVKLRNLEPASNFLGFNRNHVMSTDANGKWRIDSTLNADSIIQADILRDTSQAIRGDFPSPSAFTAVPWGRNRINVNSGVGSGGVGWSSGGPGTGAAVTGIVDSFGIATPINGTNASWFHARPTLWPLKPWVTVDSAIFEFDGTFIAGSTRIGFFRPATYDNATRTILNPDTVSSTFHLNLQTSIQGLLVQAEPGDKDSLYIPTLTTTLRHHYRIKASFVDSCEINIDRGTWVRRMGPLARRYVLMPAIATIYSGSAFYVWNGEITYFPY